MIDSTNKMMKKNCLDLDEFAAKARTVSIRPELFFAATYEGKECC